MCISDMQILGHFIRDLSVRFFYMGVLEPIPRGHPGRTVLTKGKCYLNNESPKVPRAGQALLLSLV